MSNLTEQLNQIKVDLSAGSDKLLALVKSIIKANNEAQLKETFTYLSNYSVSPFITSESVKIALEYVKGIKSEKEKIDLMMPILVYIYPYENLSTQYDKEKAEFIELCEKSNHYYELSQYYLKCEEKSPYDFNSHTPQERLVYSLTIGEACVKAGDKAAAKNWNFKAHNNYYPGSLSFAIKMRYNEFKANFSSLTDRFDDASRYFFILYSNSKDKPEVAEYFRKSAVYAILSNDANKSAQISNLLGEEKMNSLPIFQLLERIVKENIITSKELPEFKKQLCNECGYSDSYLNLIILNQNIKAISSFFSTISYDRISQITGEKIETVLNHLQDLISSKVVNSLIDQPNKMIYFSPIITEEQRKDASISKFCRELQQFTSSIK